MITSIQSGIYCAVDEGCIHLVKKAVEQSDLRAMCINTLFRRAVKYGHVDILDIFYGKYSDTLSTDSTLWASMMCLAAKRGRLNVVDWLATHGCKWIDTPNYKDNTPMHLAARKGHANIIESLIRHGSKAVNEQGRHGNTPLHFACSNGHKEACISLLPFSGLSIDAVTVTGYTPIHLAAKNGHSEIIELIVQHDTTKAAERLDRPNPNTITNTTPIHYAISNGQIETVKTLLRLGSQTLHIRSVSGKTSVHHAVLSGKLDMVEFILGLDSGNIDSINEYGNTPLHLAVDNPYLNCMEPDDSYAIVGKLLYAGSTATCIQSNNLTPLGLAAHNYNPSMIKFLVRFDAEPLYMLDCNGMNLLMHFMKFRRGKNPMYQTTLITLAALAGANEVTEECQKYMSKTNITFDEDTALNIRFEVHFSISLVHRLLFMCNRK
jgi:ankyrin repeat protein